MRAKIGDVEGDWVVHPRTYGGDLAMTHEGRTVFVSLSHHTALTFGDDGEVRQVDSLGAQMIERILLAESESVAEAMPLISIIYMTRGEPRIMINGSQPFLSLSS
jgi:hypothetical protein